MFRYARLSLSRFKNVAEVSSHYTTCQWDGQRLASSVITDQERSSTQQLLEVYFFIRFYVNIPHLQPDNQTTFLFATIPICRSAVSKQTAHLFSLKTRLLYSNPVCLYLFFFPKIPKIFAIDVNRWNHGIGACLFFPPEA